MKNVYVTSVVSILLVLARPALAGKPVNVPEVPGVSTIAGTGVLSDPLIVNDRLQSDLLGDYFHGVEGVVSHLQSGPVGSGAGDWELDTTGSSVRKLTIDFRETSDAGFTPPFSSRTLPARIITKCSQSSPTSIGGMHGLNTTLVCFMNVSFTLGRDSYVLTMNRGAYADVNDVVVTCTSVSGNPSDPNAPCTGWTVDPSVIDSTGPRNLARLLLRGKAGSLIDFGRYYMRFHVSLQK
jgi:hypothetical protein